jgi:hypothetical protein
METVAIEAIKFRCKDGTFLLDMPAWPEHPEFSVWLIASRPERIRLSKGHIDLRFDNARAIYRVDEVNVWRDSYMTTLVYSEGPT